MSIVPITRTNNLSCMTSRHATVALAVRDISKIVVIYKDKQHGDFLNERTNE